MGDGMVDGLWSMEGPMGDGRWDGRWGMGDGASGSTMAGMRVRRSLTPLVLAAFGALSSSQTPTVRLEPLTVGIVQANGHLIPFARFDGKAWSNSWPGPDEGRGMAVQSFGEIPLSWTGGTALPRDWQLWPSSTGTSHALRVSNAGYADSLCSRNWVLMTDFPRQVAGCRNCCPVPTLGIALSTDRAVRPFARIGMDAIPASVVESVFNEAEGREIARLVAEGKAEGSQVYGVPVDEGVRQAKPVMFNSLWRSRVDELYYVEGTRRYPDVVALPPGGAGRRSPPCPSVTAFSGWFWTGGSEQRPGSVARSQIVDCDLKGAEFTTPLGVLEVNGSLHAVVEVRGWESQEHAILRLARGSVTPVVVTRLR